LLPGNDFAQALCYRREVPQFVLQLIWYVLTFSAKESFYLLRIFSVSLLLKETFHVASTAAMDFQ